MKDGVFIVLPMKAMFFLLMGFAGFAMSTVARAEEAKIHPGACEADVEKFCGTAAANPGEGRIKDCLKEHEKDLSANCKTNHEAFREKAKDLIAACQSDAEALCSGVKGHKDLKKLRCLKEHQTEIKSDNCKAKIAQLHAPIVGASKK